MKKFTHRQYQIILIVLSLLYMLPLLVLSFFNTPSADDFNFSWRVYRTVQNGGGLFAILKSAFDTSLYYWHNWQGLYAAAFIMALQPAVFGHSFYALTGFLMVGIIIGSTLYTSCYIVKNVLGGTVLNGLTIGCLMSFMMIQFMPSCVEGLYWFNGTMNYTLFHALMLFLLCRLITIARTDNLKLSHAIAPMILGFLVEGTNPVTGFMSLLLIVLFVAYGILTHKKKAVLLYTLTLFVITGGFLLNILSPGTRIRQNTLTAGPGAFRSIFLSIRHGCQLMNSGITLTLLVVLILAMPILFPLASRFRINTGFSFRFPLLVLTGSIGWVCAMFCPPIYGMGTPGGGRIYDIVYYAFILLLFFNVFYLCGWLSDLLSGTNKAPMNLGTDPVYTGATTLFLLAMLFVFALDSWSIKACKALLSGEAATYHAEAAIRFDACTNGKGQDVVLPSFSVHPDLLFFSDITKDTDDWTNVAMARYFELKSVRNSDEP